MPDRELVMYTRTFGCPSVAIARRVFERTGVTCREVNVDADPEARERLLNWVGFLSVPTLFVTAPGADVPVAAPTPLADGASPRGIDRGSMLTEPNAAQLTNWLVKHGFTSE